MTADEMMTLEDFLIKADAVDDDTDDGDFKMSMPFTETHNVDGGVFALDSPFQDRRKLAYDALLDTGLVHDEPKKQAQRH